LIRIRIRSVAFGVFPEIEALNSAFSKGHGKLRITVDTETRPSVPDEQVLEHLTEAFPGLARHQCRAQQADAGVRAAGTQILLVESDPSANQAHMLEHLALEMLSALDGRLQRLSGVTCAYASPPNRNDVFVECSEPESAGFSALLAAETMNAILAGKPIRPLYPDVVQCARIVRGCEGGVWTARRLAGLLAIPVRRAEEALEVLSLTRQVEPENFSMNFSGEPHYRLAGVGMSLPPGTVSGPDSARHVPMETRAPHRPTRGDGTESPHPV